MFEKIENNQQEAWDGHFNNVYDLGVHTGLEIQADYPWFISKL